MKGKLTLIPTPIDENSPLETVAVNLILSAINSPDSKYIFVIEDLKPGRRRWVKFGLPRESIDSFVQYNEHNATEMAKQLIKKLLEGHNVYLMSDGGMPAFCDPGRELVASCHKNGIKVSATPFCNSTILALAMSGFSHSKFVFEGFLPVKKEERQTQLEKVLEERRTIILMDTPYRLRQLLEDIALVLTKKGQKERKIFVALNLNCPNEETFCAKAEDLLKQISFDKQEFILIIDSMT